MRFQNNIPTANQSQSLGTISTSSPGSWNFAVPSWANSLGVFFNNILTNGSLTVTGQQSGYTYFSSANGIAQGVFDSPIKFDIDPAYDQNVIFQWTGILLSAFSVVAYAAQTGYNTPSTSSSVSPTDPTPKVPHTGVNVIGAANTIGVLLAPPATGYVWDIKQLSIQAGTTVAYTASIAVYLTATAGGSGLLGSYTSVNGIWIVQPYVEFFLNDGITYHNGSAVGAVFVAWARQVPLASTIT
jgi:hypothetical protein